jgi:hypothetical protein
MFHHIIGLHSANHETERNDKYSDHRDGLK